MNNRHRLCAFPNCTSHATFKHVGDQHPTFCGSHREEGMVQVQHRPHVSPFLQAEALPCFTSWPCNRLLRDREAPWYYSTKVQRPFCQAALRRAQQTLA